MSVVLSLMLITKYEDYTSSDRDSNTFTPNTFWKGQVITSLSRKKKNGGGSAHSHTLHCHDY